MDTHEDNLPLKDQEVIYLNPDQTTSFLLLEYLLLEIVNRLNYLDL